MPKKKTSIPRQKGVVRKKNNKVAWGAGRKLNKARQAERNLDKAKKQNKGAKKGIKNFSLKRKGGKK